VAGYRRKHPDALAYKGAGRYRALAVVEPGQMPIPRLPKGTHRVVRAMWGELWRSPLSGAFRETDIPTLRRWAWWLGQWHRVAADVESNPIIIKGANGPTLNPAIRYLNHCESALRELEKAFGMDALSRLRLGITLTDNQAKAASLKQPARPQEM
jgi:P27 family predicted phage terminase small subunit